MIASALWSGIHRKLIRIRSGRRAGGGGAFWLGHAAAGLRLMDGGSAAHGRNVRHDARIRVGRPSQARGQSRVFCHLPRLGRVPGRRCFGQLVGDLATASRIRNSIRAMPPGSRLLVADADVTDAAVAIEAALSHAPNLRRHRAVGLVSRLFVVPGSEILRAREGAREHVDNEDGDTPTISRVMASSDGPSPSGPTSGRLAVDLRLHDCARGPTQMIFPPIRIPTSCRMIPQRPRISALQISSRSPDLTYRHCGTARHSAT